MPSFFSSEGSFPLQFAIIFAVIFVILAAVVFVIRRLGGKGMPLSDKNSARGRQPRLGIVDIYELDRQRQLILLRRDNVEHLLLVGGPNDVVIERNILRGISARLPPEETAFDEAPEPTLNPLPEPSIAHQTQPAPAPAYQPIAPYREPTFEMPVVVSAPVPGSDAPPPAVGRPLGALGHSEPIPEPLTPEVPVSEISTPEAPLPDPGLTARPRESQLARVIRRTPPSIANLVPAGLAERVGFPGTPEQASPRAPVAHPAAPPPAPVSSAPATRGIDAAILSDMARQLEEALRRPSAAVRPAMPVQPAPIPPAEAEAGMTAGEREPAPHGVGPVSIDPIAAAMAATARGPAPTEPAASEASAGQDLFFADMVEAVATDRPAGDQPASATDTSSGSSAGESESTPFERVNSPERENSPEPVRERDSDEAREAVQEIQPVQENQPVRDTPPVQEPEPSQDSTAVVHEVVADAPKPTDNPPGSTANQTDDQPPLVAPVTPAPKPTKAAPTPNPFSVEEIEAEFARLLGRPLDRKS